MKKRISTIILSAVLCVALLLLAGCVGNGGSNLGGGNDPDGKRVPVYQGMTITAASTKVVYQPNRVYLDPKEDHEDNGNHYGQLKGDHTGNKPNIDKDKPFPDNDANENIEEETKSSLNVIGSSDEIYYATPGEYIYINIHIDNPDNFEIMSFTLNDKKYSSYMFEDGSDMETIILKYNVGESAGIVEYTIDAIKYIDGTEIKDVIIDGNKTVKAGIRTEGQVAANVTGVDVGTNALSFNVNIKDNYKLVEFSGGALKTVLYDGFNIVSEKDLALGDNTVIFDGLKTSTVYQYAVVAYYDDLSGAGFGMNVLYKDAFNTDAVVLFDNVTIGPDSVSFDFLWHEDHKNGTITDMKLYKDGSLVKTVSSQSIDGLLSNNTYKLVAEYANGDVTERIYIEFTTLEKGTPFVTIHNPASTQTSISFSISETDENNVGAISKIELLLGSNVVATATSTEQVIFDQLLSGNIYTIRITYTYDLNDGNGAQTIVKMLDVTTLAKATPLITVDSSMSTQNSVGFVITENDVDNVGAITKIELIHGNDVTIADNLGAREFAGLLSDNSYVIRVTYTYDLNDGNGAQTIVKTLDVKTLAKATPSITVDSSMSTQNSVGFVITENDVDNVGAITKIELIHGNDVTIADNLGAREFAGLLSDNSYIIRVTYTYDLCDGNGAQTIVKTLDVKTLAKATPSITVDSSMSTQNSVGFVITENDVDNVGAITKIELIHGNDVTIADNLDAREFAGLLSDNSYIIRVTYTYDLCDGNGAQTIVKTLDVTTLAKTAPTITINDDNVTTDSISASYTVTDADNILASHKIELYKGAILVGGANEINFTGLSYYTDYTVKITYTYDLCDGKGLQTNVVDKAYKTLPSIDVTGCNVANTSAVSEGETIFMQVSLDNPLGMTVESVVVNGQTYSVTGASTKNKIFVEIVYNGQFAGGDTYLKVDKINAKIDNTTLSVEPKTELSDNVFINGKLEVLKVEFVNEDFKPIDWAFPNESVFMLVTFNNPTGYNIDSIDYTATRSNYDSAYTGSRLTRIDNNRWYIAVDVKNGLNRTRVSSITYSNKYISAKTVSMNMDSPYLYVVASQEVKYVYNASDLKNMNGGYYYELKNDIDLAGIEWIGADFEGVFDAKGYSIKNMSFVGSIKTSDAYLGLFGRGNGIINNLNIKEATIVVEASSNDGKEYTVCCGGIVGATSYLYLKLDNCTVDEYSIFSINAINSNLYVGGLVGSVNGHTRYTYGTTRINNCVNNASISAITSTYASVGGLVGNISTYDLMAYITNCTNNGDVNGNDYVGGLIGSSQSVTFKNCTNSGNVSGDDHVGGLVGSSDYGTITNCSNSGNVSGNESVGGLVGYSHYGTITNCTNNGDVNGNNSIGGLVGSSDYGTITNCTNSGNVSGSGYYVGGLVGSSYYGTITNCTNSGNVSGSGYYVGGLVGSSDYGTITNCSNSRNVSGNNSIGGLVGSSRYETITNCTNSGNVSANGRVGGLIGYSPESSKIANSYSLTQGDSVNGELCTIEQLNSKAFYTEVLGWSEDVWDLSELDVANGKYPKLK